MTVLLLSLACAPGAPVDADGDGHALPMDCDDADDAVHPGASEACGNGLDDDCDGAATGCGPAGWVDLAGADARVLGPADEINETRLEMAAALGDADGDGLADVLVRADQGYPEDETRLWLLPGPLEGDIHLDERAAAFTDATTGQALAGGDLDGDGLGDAALTTWDGVAEQGLLYVLAGPLEAGGAREDTRATLTMPPSFWRGDVVVAGDTDGDGVAELLVGDRSAVYGGEDAGAAWVVPGTVTEGAAIDDVGVRLDGAAAESAGHALTAGDIDGDGLADVVVAAGAWAWVVPGPVLPGALTDTGTRVGGLQTLWSLATGDTDGDGTLDLVLGGHGDGPAPTVDGEMLGAAFVFRGPLTGERAADTVDATFHGEPDTWYAARAVAVADLDGDGRAEVAYSGATGWAGDAVYVFRGPTAGTHTALDAHAVLLGAENADPVLRSAGDLDADGFDDLLIVGALYATAAEERGAAWLVRGGPGF